jgi:nicotinate dehydrogenase subunit A
MEGKVALEEHFSTPMSNSYLAGASANTRRPPTGMRWTRKPILLRVNGATHQVRCQEDTPLLYVLRNDLGLNGPKFGCGLGQCGACTVIIKEAAVRSCSVPVGSVGTGEVTTLEGLSRNGELHPLQAAFLEEQAAQCGYCSNGMIMTAKVLIEAKKPLEDNDIRAGLSGLLCRCGIHNRIVRAVRKAAQAMAR